MGGGEEGGNLICNPGTRGIGGERRLGSGGVGKERLTVAEFEGPVPKFDVFCGIRLTGGAVGGAVGMVGCDGEMGSAEEMRLKASGIEEVGLAGPVGFEGLALDWDCNSEEGVGVGFCPKQLQLNFPIFGQLS